SFQSALLAESPSTRRDPGPVPAPAHVSIRSPRGVSIHSTRSAGRSGTRSFQSALLAESPSTRGEATSGTDPGKFQSALLAESPSTGSAVRDAVNTLPP